MERVLYWFKEISKIPRGSGNTDAIADFCCNFAKERNFWVRRDFFNNVIIKKSGTKGYESAAPVILQGHTDMVCAKDPDVEFDFFNDGIKILEKDGYLTADGTTLGADNGIAVAMILALLESDLPHPPVEAILTSDEEIGLIGAIGLDTADIIGRKMINLDSEDVTTFTVSCAGGVVAEACIPLTERAFNGKKYKISISGLQGGHSGVEIHKGNANANVLMSRILNELGDVGVISLYGGEKDNVITSAATAEIVSSIDITSKVGMLADEISSEYREQGMYIECIEQDEFSGVAYDSSFAGFLFTAPNGVLAMSYDIPGLVKTSVNMGIVRISDGKLKASFSVRSSVESEKALTLKKISALTHAFGGSVTESGDYPGWDFNPDSEFLYLMKDSYSELFGTEPKIEAIHAGLECGVFAGKLPGLECVSIGPDALDIHSTAERVSLESIEKCWTLVKEVLKRSSKCK